MTPENGDGPVVDPVPVEARSFQGQRAGVVSRTIAAVIDAVVVAAVLAGGYAVWFAVLFMLNPTSFTPPAVNPFASLVAAGVVLFLYLTASWAGTGQTYGDHVMGLRVVNFRGRRLRLPGAALRAVFCVTFPIGLYWCAVSRQNRSVQDIVLRTSVIYDWHPHRERP
jgi:uncharacterized RDD family membrane protein YckC